MNSHHKHTLTNGLELLTLPMPSVKSVTAMVLVGAGSRYEAARINGLSHFLEHMAFKGSQKRPSALAISGAIDGIGGEFNAFTGKDHTGFYIKASVDHLPLLIDVLSDMILNPVLDPVEIEREKGVIIEEINMYEDTPMRHIGDVYEELLYGANHPLGRDTAGKPEIIRSIKRQDFVDYMQVLYRPNNAVMIVAGGIGDKLIANSLQQTAVRTLVEENLKNWQKKKTLGWKKFVEEQKKASVKVKYKKTEQAHLALGVRAYPLEHPKKYALSVLATILGGGMSSRLFIEVRERRGLAYYVHTNADQYLDTGTLVTQAGVQVGQIEEAIKVIVNQYLGVADGHLAVTNEELTKAKEYLKGRLTLELEDSRSVAGFYGTQEILKRKIITPEEAIVRTDAVTLDEVMEVAREIFVPEKLNLAIIGPYKEEGRFEKLLK